MLTEVVIQSILATLPRLRIGVVGDLFLDRYLDLDATLTEPSIETGLDAYQVANVRAYPGAAGTVLNNLAALGVGAVRVLSLIGDDGEGYELRRELERRRVDQSQLLISEQVRTPTYVKPMLQAPGQPARELNRLDVKNRRPTPATMIDELLARLPAFVQGVDALIVIDQVSEPECGVITTAVRDALARLAQDHTTLPMLADSRERIGLFRHLALKPNASECLKAAGETELETAVGALAQKTGRPVFCTRGQAGILLAEPGPAHPVSIPAYPVTGPIDVVGAGDSTSAGIIVAWAAGAALTEAAAFGCLIASITIQQLGVTGTASPGQVLTRWQELRKQD